MDNDDDDDDDNNDNDDTHPPRIIVRVGMVFRRGQKTDLTRKAWKIDQRINKQTVEFEKKIDRFLNGVYNTEWQIELKMSI